MSSLFKVFTILTPHDIRHCCLLGVLMLMGAFLEAVGIGAILPFISILGQPDWLLRHGDVARFVAAFGISSHSHFVMFCAGGLICFYTAKNVYLAWELRQQLDFSLGNQVCYATQLYAGYMNKPYLFHLDHNTAVLLRNTYEGPTRTFTELLLSTLGLLTELVTALIIWGMIVVVDPFTATAVAVILFGLVYLILKACRKAIGRQGVEANRTAAVMHQWVNQGLGAIKETKVLGKEVHFCAAYSDACNKYCEALRGYRFLSQVPRYIVEIAVVIGMLLLVTAKLVMGEKAEEIVPLLGVLSLAAFRLMPCVNRCVGYVNTIRFSLPVFDEVREDFIEIRTLRMQGKERMMFSSSQQRMPFVHEITAKHVRFSYPRAGQDILSDVSVSIPKGSFVGIVGASGVGKTTFVDILLGLLEPDSGQILVDGIDIRGNVRAWQDNLAYVPQTIYLVDGTIRENVALGLEEEEINDNRVEIALQMAELYDYVEGLPDGVQTQVGEHGVKLSGGQRQRVGIARALYYAPEVLVLDEATSALDDDTERSITDTVLRLKGKVTIIAVAHRMTTLANCDFKVRFENGRATLE